MDVHPDIVQWKKTTAEFDQQWGTLSSAMSTSSIEPMKVDLSLPVEDMIQSAVKDIECTYTVYNVLF